MAQLLLLPKKNLAIWDISEAIFPTVLQLGMVHKISQFGGVLVSWFNTGQIHSSYLLLVKRTIKSIQVGDRNMLSAIFKLRPPDHIFRQPATLSDLTL
jgi:hypothetical protein